MELELQSEEQELGHYQLRRLLGEGGFGQVYEAWDSKLQRSIAIKRLKPQLLSARPDNLLDEARMAASLRHPAFVKIFSIDGDAEQQSIIMEYVDGSTLRQLVQGETLPEAQVLDIVGQVAEAMVEAHASKLIHGDIKPANLMLEMTGTVRIMDFGLARRIDPQSTESTVLDDAQGTIAYLAPELMLGTRPNELSDVYALGVVMYEMLTGERPFSHLKGLALAAAHLQTSSQAWPFPETVSPQLVSLVCSMTMRDTAQRLGSMQAVRKSIADLRGEVVRKRPAQKVPSRLSMGAWWRASRLIAAGATALTLVVGATIYFTVSSSWFSRNTPFFSETDAMQTGLAALKSFDRDDSLDVAIKQFTAVLDRQPAHAAAAAGLSFAYGFKHTGDSRDETWLQRADASAQLALKSNDQLAMAHAAQAAVRLAQGKASLAVELADQALRLDPRNLFGLVVKGDALSKARRFDEAEKVLREATVLYPKERVLEDLLGTVYYQQGDYAKAERAFRRSIVIEPAGVIAYANLSHAVLRQNRGDEALQVLQQGLQIRPSGQLYSNLGTALFNRGDYLGAANAFERAVTSSKGNANHYLRWANLADTLRWIPGRAEDSRQAYVEAIALLKPLVERAPGDVTLASRMGLYSARLGDRAAAVSFTMRALKAAPDSADVRFRAGMAYELIGERASALLEINHALARGYSIASIRSEPDLISLRRDPQFRPPTKESDK